MKDAQYALAVIDEMEAQIESLDKRKAIAAIFAKNFLGDLSPEAIAVYLSYAGEENATH